MIRDDGTLEYCCELTEKNADAFGTMFSGGVTYDT